MAETSPAAKVALFDERVRVRTAALRDARPDWPCRRGCDGCCRSLARPLEITRAEWARVDEAVSKLEPAARAVVQDRVEALVAALASGEARGPFVCPYLDESQGACRIYEARPLACRTYGFFVARDGPEYCSIIERDIALRGEAGLVWGNADALASEVESALGPRISFREHHS